MTLESPHVTLQLRVLDEAASVVFPHVFIVDEGRDTPVFLSVVLRRLHTTVARRSRNESVSKWTGSSLGSGIYQRWWVAGSRIWLGFH